MPTPSVEDRCAITDLMTEYTSALDRGDVEGVANCFAPSGWLDSPIVGRHQGRAELLAFAERTAQAVRDGARFRHVISNMRVSTYGDRGRVECYLLDYVTIEGRTELLSPGEYDCEVVRIGGRWLLQSRIVRMDRAFTIPGEQ